MLDQFNCDYDFKNLLDDCYFHPSRKYPSESVKLQARMAMTMLWQTSTIEFSCFKFYQTDIRRMMIDEMMPDDLDRAIDIAEKLHWQIEFSEFVLLVFLCVLFSDAITQTEFEMTFCKSFAEKFNRKRGEIS